MLLAPLLVLALLLSACEADEPWRPDPGRVPAAGDSCSSDQPDRWEADCGASLTCLYDRCWAPQGTPCTTDADCGGKGACFLEEGICRYDQTRECPHPPDVGEPLRCVDWDPQECPCYAGEIAFHETSDGGRLSCDGLTGVFADRLRLQQTGCSFVATGGELSGAAVGFGEIKLQLAWITNDGSCTATPERWSEAPGEEGSPAVRITCSATCKFWMEQFLPLVPEVVVPSGTFAMGTPAAAQPAGVIDEAPEHPVETSCFTMDAFEVSRHEYLLCLEEGACEAPDYLGAGEDEPTFFSSAHALLPVTSVTQRQAEQYCSHHGKVLPTEADWERAARGASTAMTTFPWGDEAPDCTRGNFSGCGDALLPTMGGGAGPRRDALPPGSVEPPDAPASIGGAGSSWYGVYDLAGNVREWTRDYYVARAYEARTLDVPNRDPETTEPGTEGAVRVVRGGSYLTPFDGRALQASAREAVEEGATAADLGFRCVRYGTRAP